MSKSANKNFYEENYLTDIESKETNTTLATYVLITMATIRFALSCRDTGGKITGQPCAQR